MKVISGLVVGTIVAAVGFYLMHYQELIASWQNSSDVNLSNGLYQYMICGAVLGILVALINKNNN
jgi:H+/Cl- antiporter ClcA